jgi:hypothetical protein
MKHDSKLARVRKAMAEADWEEVLRLVAKFPSLGEYEVAIRRAKEAIVNPKLYRELGYDPDQLVRDGIQAIKDKYSRSWEASQLPPDPRRVTRKGSSRKR